MGIRRGDEKMIKTYEEFEEAVSEEIEWQGIIGSRDAKKAVSENLWKRLDYAGYAKRLYLLQRENVVGTAKREMREIKLKEVKLCFIGEDNQSVVLENLYTLVYPDWEDIEKVDGFPEISRDLWQDVSERFMEFDRINHPSVMAGGLWMNNGFSSDPSLPDGMVRAAPVTMKP